MLVERAVNDVTALRTDISEKFEMSVRLEVSETGGAITCRPGCASCCYHPVMITVLEGITIYRWLQKRGKWTDNLKKKLKDASDKQYGTSFETWLFAMIPCPLLTEKNLCSVYEARPLICRSYYATSDPDACHPHRLGENTKIVDRTAAVDPFHAKQEEILKRHKLHFGAVPIGTALLLGERICTGDLDLESVDIEVLKEYVEKG